MLMYGLASQLLCCSHSNTPVDELLGKPYQDEMLALIESYQDTKSKEHSDPPDDLTLTDDQVDNKESIHDQQCQNVE